MEYHKIASVSRIGGRAENQDYYQVEETRFGLLTIVCDGMGGMSSGKVAAEMAVNKISEGINNARRNDPSEAIGYAIARASDAIYEEFKKRRIARAMGTTVVVLLINEHYALCYHVGDSRCYQLREGNILFRTFDHSAVFEDVSAGILTEEEARVSPDSKYISRALGIERGLEMTRSEKLIYKKEDRFLICTDGIWNPVPEPQLIQMVSQQQPIEEVINHLSDTIDQIGMDKGNRHDNLTGVLIEMQRDSRLQAEQ